MDRRRAALTRARVRSYNAVNHTADLEPIAAPEALMDNVPCLQNIPATDLIAGTHVLVLVWEDVGGLVLGAYGGTPTGGTSIPSPHDILGAHHSISGGANLDLVGQDAADSIERVTPSDDPGATSKVLKTDAGGMLTLKELDVTGDTWLGGYLTHEGDHAGFFGTTPAIQTAVADQAAWAAVTSGADHVDLSDLNTKLQAIRDKLQALLDALQSYGLI